MNIIEDVNKPEWWLNERVKRWELIIMWVCESDSYFYNLCYHKVILNFFKLNEQCVIAHNNTWNMKLYSSEISVKWNQIKLLLQFVFPQSNYGFIKKNHKKFMVNFWGTRHADLGFGLLDVKYVKDRAPYVWIQAAGNCCCCSFRLLDVDCKLRPAALICHH